MQRYLMKKRRASQSVGHGLAKLFNAWTHSDAARTWQKSRVAYTKTLDLDHQSTDIVDTHADQDCEECH